MRAIRKSIAAILLMAAASVTPGQAHRQAGATPQDLALQQQLRALPCLKPQARADRLVVIAGNIGKEPTYAHAGLHASVLRQTQELLAAYHPFLTTRSITEFHPMVDDAEAFVSPGQVSRVRDLLDVVSAARSGPQAVQILCAARDCTQPGLATAVRSVSDDESDTDATGAALLAKITRDYLYDATDRRSAHLLARLVAQADAGLPRHEAADLVEHVVMLLRVQGDASSEAALAALSAGAAFLESRGVAGTAAAKFNEDSGLGHVARVARVLDGKLSLDDAHLPPLFTYSPCRRLMAGQDNR